MNLQRVRALFLRQLGQTVSQRDILAACGYALPGDARADAALARQYVYLMRHREGMVIDRRRGRGWVLRGFAL